MQFLNTSVFKPVTYTNIQDSKHTIVMTRQCAWCKKILGREYLTNHDAKEDFTTHGICPSCLSMFKVKK